MGACFVCALIISHSRAPDKVMPPAYRFSMPQRFAGSDLFFSLISYGLRHRLSYITRWRGFKYRLADARELSNNHPFNFRFIEL